MDCSLSNTIFLRLSFPRHLNRCKFAAQKLLAMDLIILLTASVSGPSGFKFPSLYQDVEGSMHLFKRHKDQMAVSHCLTAFLIEVSQVEQT